MKTSEPLAPREALRTYLSIAKTRELFIAVSVKGEEGGESSGEEGMARKNRGRKCDLPAGGGISQTFFCLFRVPNSEKDRSEFQSVLFAFSRRSQKPFEAKNAISLEQPRHHGPHAAADTEAAGAGAAEAAEAAEAAQARSGASSSAARSGCRRRRGRRRVPRAAAAAAAGPIRAAPRLDPRHCPRGPREAPRQARRGAKR